MAVRCGESAQIWMQTKDGVMIELTGMVREYSLSSSITGLIEMDLSIVSGDGDMSLLFNDSKHPKVSELRAQKEWQCSYCGRPNAKHRETCKSCGAVRPFIYD